MKKKTIYLSAGLETQNTKSNHTEPTEQPYQPRYTGDKNETYTENNLK